MIVGKLTADRIYLTQWIYVGFSPRLVFYEGGANLNQAGEVAEVEDLEIVTAWAGKV